MKICAVRLSVVPAVAHLRGDPRVAWLAERHQIGYRVCPALGERQLVVDFLGWRVPAGFQALLAQRVRRDITVADTFPRSAVMTAGRRVAAVLLVAFGFQLGVFLTVPSIGQPGTAGIRAGTFRFPWHRHTSFRAEEKPCRSGLPQGSRMFYFVHHNTIIRGASHSLSFTLMMAATQESAVSCIR